MSQPIPFSNTVRALVNAINEFHALLDREAQALAAGKLDGLTELSRDKMQLSEQLDRLDRQRRAGIANATRTQTDLEAMTEALLQCNNGTALLQDWKAALEKLRQCRSANELAGAQIHAQTRRSERALEILAGDMAAAVTYGPGGASRMAHRSKEFGLA